MSPIDYPRHRLLCQSANAGLLFRALSSTPWKILDLGISLYGLLQATSKFSQPFVAAVIRMLRIKREWTQEELALEVGVSNSEISHLESGRRNPRLGTLERLADTFEVRCSHLLWLAEELEFEVQQLEQ